MILSDHGDTPREMPPEGTCQAVGFRFFDLGEEEYQGKKTHKCVCLWEIEHRYKTGEYEGKRFLVPKFYAAYLSPGSKLRADLQLWRGKAITDDEAKHFNTDKTRGKGCYLTIIHEEKNAKVRANVSGIMALPDGVAPLSLETPPDYVPEWVKKIQQKNGVVIPPAETVLNKDAEGHYTP